MVGPAEGNLESTHLQSRVVAVVVVLATLTPMASWASLRIGKSEWSETATCTSSKTISILPRYDPATSSVDV
jgi:hypothetical protein